MKILILSDANSIHTYRWARSLNRNGKKISIFSLSESKNKFNPSYEELGINVFSFKLNRIVFFKFKRNITKLSYYFALRDIRNIVVKIKPDLIHAHYLSSYGVLAYLSRFKPYYVSVWGDDIFLPFKNFFLKKLLKNTLKNSNQVFSTSNSIYSTILSKYSIKSKVIAFGVNTNQFKPTIKKLDNQITLGIIKSIEPHNGIEFLIEAFKILNDKNLKNIKLNIVGTGQSENKIKKLVKNYNLNDKVSFFGKISHHEIIKYYQALSIFICPSLRESFGVSVIEASSCGLPVIANNIDGLNEVVENNKTGFLIDTSNAKLLADNLEKLIINKSLRRELGKNGREFVRKYYDWDICVAKMMKYYEL